MCGIVGWVGHTPSASPTGFADGLESIRHRGPDASGSRLLPLGGTSATIGAVRLRIIDVSEQADQPICNEDGSAWVVFNGELYNHLELRKRLQAEGHHFATRSDTEVLVHLYESVDGDEHRMLEALRGMFAFAIVDQRRCRVLLARDRLGIKPVYLADQPGGGFAFASEVRALAAMGAVSAQPDLVAVQAYLLRGVIPGPRTIFEGVRELPPGSCVTWDGERTVESLWWRPTFSAGHRADPSGLAPILEDAVARHLIAERPVGVFLSSGVDSGSLASVAARVGAVRTFTVTFPDEASDEGAAARSLAETIGAEHVEVPVSGVDVVSAMPTILASMDQPTSDGVNSWLVCRAAHDAGLVVALSGLGGDELFGGYATFQMVPKVARASRIIRSVPFRERAAAAWDARRPGSRVSRVLGGGTGLTGAYLATRGLFPPSSIPGLSPTALALASGGTLPAFEDPRDSVSFLEMTRYLPDQTLRDADQMSMAHSLEVRVPLLDDDVVAHVTAVAAADRFVRGKKLLTDAASLSQVLPKRPFALPFETWLRGPLRDQVREGLLSEELPFADVIPSAFRRRLWDALEGGHVHWSRPWAVTVLRTWPGSNGFNW